MGDMSIPGLAHTLPSGCLTSQIAPATWCLCNGFLLATGSQMSLNTAETCVGVSTGLLHRLYAAACCPPLKPQLQRELSMASCCMLTVTLPKHEILQCKPCTPCRHLASWVVALGSTMSPCTLPPNSGEAGRPTLPQSLLTDPPIMLAVGKPWQQDVPFVQQNDFHIPAVLLASVDAADPPPPPHADGAPPGQPLPAVTPLCAHFNPASGLAMR